VLRSQFHGLSAEALFDSKSPDGCIETFVSLVVSHSGDSIFIIQDDNCTGTIDFRNNVTMPIGDFQVSNDLRSANFSATFPDPNINVSVSWTATGPLGHDTSTSQFHNGSFTTIVHSDATFRLGAASGTVSDGTTNFTPSPSFFAQIMSARSGIVTITRS
jgi:hypothetical protein